MIITELNNHANKGAQERSVVLNIILFYMLILYSILSIFIYPYPATALLLIFSVLITWRLIGVGYSPLFLFKLLLSMETLVGISSVDHLKQDSNGKKRATHSTLKGPIVDGKENTHKPIHLVNRQFVSGGNGGMIRKPFVNQKNAIHIIDKSIQITEDQFSDEAFTNDIDELKERTNKDMFAFEMQQDYVNYKRPTPSKLSGILDKIRTHDMNESVKRCMELAKPDRRTN